jgi:hypothetical protein
MAGRVVLLHGGVDHDPTLNTAIDSPDECAREVFALLER